MPIHTPLMDKQEHFMREIATAFPKHIQALGQNLSEEAFIDMLFEENLGSLMLKLKTVANDNVHLLELWNRFFESSIESLAERYEAVEENRKVAMEKARLVLTELSVHSERYANDLEAFRDLLKHQKIKQSNE